MWEKCFVWLAVLCLKLLFQHSSYVLYQTEQQKHYIKAELFSAKQTHDETFVINIHYKARHVEIPEQELQYFSKPGDTFLVLPGRRNATACPAWRRLGLPCAALPGQARRSQTHALGR